MQPGESLLAGGHRDAHGLADAVTIMEQRREPSVKVA
jgi:hypothetical protein